MITKLRKFKKKSWQVHPSKFRRNLGGQVFFSIFLVFLVILVIGFLVFTNWKINQKRAELQQRIETLKKEIQILEEKNAFLKAGISQTESEEYQNRWLYEQEYFEKGAIPVVVLPPAGKKEEKTSEEKNPWNPKSWWQWLKSKVGD